MQRRLWIHIAALLWLISCGSRGAPRRGAVDDGPIARVATDDGLELAFDTRLGRVVSFGSATWHAALAEDGPRMGVSLGDHQGASLVDVDRSPALDITRAPGALRVVRASDENRLRVTEEWRAHPRHIELEATIEDTSPQATPAARGVARGVEACLNIPADLVGQRWHGHLHQSQLIEPDARHETVVEESLDIGHYTASGLGSHMKTRLPINLHGLNAVGDERGALAIGAHPDTPAAYHVRYQAPSQQTGGMLRACFHLGLDPDHLSRPNRATLRLVLFAVDQPEWALRSALDEYLAMFPDHARGTLPRRHGMTVGGGYNFAHYPAPERFHIDTAWNATFPESHEHGMINLLYAWPTGYLDRGVRLSTQPAPLPCAECDRSMDAQVNACLDLYRDYEDGAVRFPETCDDTWGQTGCRTSPVLPTEDKRYGPVRIGHGFFYLRPSQVVAPTDLALRLFGTFAMYEPFAASILRTADDRYDGALSDSHALMAVPGVKDMYTCYINGLNPDPGVAGSRPEQPDDGLPPVNLGNFGQLNLEIAKRALGVYGDDYVYRDPKRGAIRYDGVALDTVGAYLRPDFNEEMVHAASRELAYDPETGRPVALEHLSLDAFMTELRQVMPKSAAIAINGYPISGTLGRGVDIFVRELGRRYRKLEGDAIPRHYYELYDDDEDTRARRVFRARMVAYQRPITFWARFLLTEERAAARGVTPEAMLRADMERYLPLYTAKGIYVFIQRTGLPGRDRMLGAPQDPALLALYERHLDTVHALTRAGWQVMPWARASDPAVSVERFGQGYFTLYNQSAEAKRVTVAIEWSRIADNGAAPKRMRDLESGALVELARADDGAYTTGAIDVPAFAARVIMAAP